MGDPLPAAAVSHEPVMPDFMKPVRQNVPQKSFDKLKSIKGNLLPDNPALSVVLISKPDLLLLDADQALIADGHPVGVAANVTHNLIGLFKRRLAVDHPFAGGQLVQPEFKATAVGQLLIRKCQPAIVISFFEAFDELATKHL